MDTDGELLLRLRSGDERAFAVLVERYHEPMLRLAASFVPSGAVAEEVVQDTWLAVLRGLENFEGPAPFRGAPGRLPALHRVPGADARDHKAHRPARIRGPDPADEGGVHRPLPPVAVRAAVTRVRVWCHRDRQPS